MVSVVVRVWMPDRPGALGQVASRIGAVRGDVLAIDILERGAGRAIDELTVELPSKDLIALLSSEVDAVDGVSVEEVRIVEGDRIDPNLTALAIGAALAEANLDDRLAELVTGVETLVSAEWAAVLRGHEVIAQVGVPPDIEWLIAFLVGSEHLYDADESLPTDLVWVPMTSTGLTVAAGRSGRPIHERERVRVSLLARMADALL